MARRTTPRLSEASAEFIRQRFARSGSRGVRYGYTSLLRRFAEANNDCQVGSLTPGHVDDYFYGKGGLHETCGRTTLGRYRNDFKTFFMWCYRRGYLALHADLMVDGIAEKSTRTKRPRTRLDAHELLRLLDCAEDARDRALLAFVANTGVRISEALGMRVGDVDLAKGTLYVRVIKTKEADSMPINEDLDRELRTWLTVYTTEHGALDSSWYLFPAKPGFKFVNRVPTRIPGYKPESPLNNPGLILKRVAERAGVRLDTGDGWHTIRRSVARIYFDMASAEGHDAALRQTSALLHHTSTETTERYLGLELEKRKRDEVLKGKPFLTKVASDSNVVPLKRTKEA